MLVPLIISFQKTFESSICARVQFVLVNRRRSVWFVFCLEVLFLDYITVCVEHFDKPNAELAFPLRVVYSRFMRIKLSGLTINLRRLKNFLFDYSFCRRIVLVS
jgi:hypothetical protein